MKLIIPLLFTFLLLHACNSENHADLVSFTSDLEQTSSDKFNTSSSFKLSGAKFQSDKFSRSGNYSVRLDSSAKKALRGEIKNLKIGDEIDVKVWRLASDKNKGELVVKIGHPMVFKSSTPVSKEGDWELLEIKLAIPREFKGHKLIWYVSNNGKEEVYYDDFSLYLKRNKGLVLQTHPALPQVSLAVKEEGLEKIETKRQAAIENGVLVTNSDDWVKTKISWDGDKKKGKIRLKGDWTDHLYGQKFSLRVNISKGKTLNTYSKFAIQNPVSRHYLDEWFIHKILEKEAILTTRYEFADVYINDESIGLYAIEEHFTNELLLAQGRKISPIFKFSEDDLWYSRHINKKRETKGVPWYSGSVIEVFSQDKIVENPVLLNDFYRGRELMYHFKFKEGKASTIVEIEKMASYIAMMDLCAGYHSVIWHNQRFYYNAEKDVLEPLVYDIFQESSRLKKEPMPFLGMQYVNKPKSYQVNTTDFLFQDEEFVKWYIHYLEKYSSPEYFDSIFQELQEEIALYEEEINKEYDYYSFNLDIYHERAKGVRDNLDAFKSGIASLLNKGLQPHYGTFRVAVDYNPIKNVSIHAYMHFLSGKTELQVQSFYYKPIDLIGIVAENNQILWDNPVRLPAYPKTNAPNTTVVEINNIAKSVIFKYEGNDSLFTQKVVQYRAPIEIKGVNPK